MPRKVTLAKESPCALTYKPGQVRALFHWLDKQTEFTPPAGELSIAFLSEETLAALHGRFLDDPSPTDVITFPGLPEEDFAGEICVSVSRAASEAESRKTAFSEELTLYLVHGWLHLCGLDDIEPTARASMREAENLLMGRARDQGRIPAFML